jgi:HAD superfamily hydrolase (TIGR01509 family)
MEMMDEIGLPITLEIFRSDFLGRSFSSAAQRTATRFGRSMPDDFQMNYRQRLLSVMRGELKPMPGVTTLLPLITVPYWLATSSSPSRLAASLEATGLDKWFAGKCSTASEVENGKPSPDLFLLAASRMQVLPHNCLVIEDSELGVRAALNAGMHVWHFQGGAHVRQGYRLPADIVPHRQAADMAHLQQAFAERGLCSL